MTSELLTGFLAERVMGWRVAPGRFMMGGRRWKPSWRFQPTKKLEDAFRLLDAADPEACSINCRRRSDWVVRVQIRGTVGEAADSCKARAIAHAVARAIGLEPEGRKLPKTGVDRR